MSAVGIKTDLFDVPVCNSFKAKVLNDQLCYEVDLNIYSNKNNTKKELESGFAFLMDYNEDRQVTYNDDSSENQSDDGLVNWIVKSSDQQSANIYINSIGEMNLQI